MAYVCIWQRICMAMGQYPRWTSGIYTASSKALQVIMIRPCLPSRIRCPKSYYGGTTDCSHAEEDCINHGGTTSRNGQGSHYHCYCASQLTEVDGRPLQRRHRRSTATRWFN